MMEILNPFGVGQAWSSIIVFSFQGRPWWIEERRGAPPAREDHEPRPTAKKSPGSHRLISENGETVFHLSVGSETSIGRRDPVTGIDPDVDLTTVDTHRSTSRAHAKIYHRGRKFFLREEIGTSNGTFVNENRLQTGVPVELVDGDQVRFGLVKLLFRVGDS